MDRDTIAEQYWNILQYNNELLRYSEVKAGLILTVYGILFTVLYNTLEPIQLAIEEHWLLFALASIFSLTTVVSIYYCFRCFIPRIEKNNPLSYIFFGDVASKFKDGEEYFVKMEEMIYDETKYCQQLAEQIHVNARIASKKFKNVSQAIKLLVVAIFSIVLFVLVSMLFT